MFKGCVKDVEKAETLVKYTHSPCQSQSTESAEPPKKKPKVDRCDMENRKIMERSCLDLSINLAQQLLKRQFPKVNGLQLTLFQFKKRVGKPPKNQLKSSTAVGTTGLLLLQLAAKVVRCLCMTQYIAHWTRLLLM